MVWLFSFNQKSKFKNQESHIKWASEESSALGGWKVGGWIGIGRE
jgi:hypothetical protein